MSFWQGLKYADCILCDEIRLSTPQKKSVLYMTLTVSDGETSIVNIWEVSSDLSLPFTSQ